MTMHRREFLLAGAALPLAAMLPQAANAQAFAPKPETWLFGTGRTARVQSALFSRCVRSSWLKSIR